MRAPGGLRHHECSPIVAANLPGATRPGTVGKPLPGVELLVLDLDTEKPVGRTSSARAREWADGFPRLHRLRRAVAVQGAGWQALVYDGDLVTIDDDGFVHFSGRMKRFLKAGAK